MKITHAAAPATTLVPGNGIIAILAQAAYPVKDIAWWIINTKFTFGQFILSIPLVIEFVLLPTPLELLILIELSYYEPTIPPLALPP